MGSFVHVRIIAYFDFDVNPKLKQNVNKISQQVFSMVKKLQNQHMASRDVCVIIYWDFRISRRCFEEICKFFVQSVSHRKDTITLRGAGELTDITLYHGCDKH